MNTDTEQSRYVLYIIYVLQDENAFGISIVTFLTTIGPAIALVIMQIMAKSRPVNYYIQKSVSQLKSLKRK